MLFRELDEKLNEEKLLLTKSELMLSRCISSVELQDIVDKLHLTALDTHDIAIKSQV